MIKILFFTIPLLIACNNSFDNPNSKNKAPVEYELVRDWPQLPKEFKLGNPTGIGIDSNQDIVVFHRASREWPLIGPMPGSFISEKTILLLDKTTGKIINSWGESMFIMPHGLTVDQNNNIWVTDVALHQVFKFTHDGRLLMKIGEATINGNDSTHFNRPTDVAVSKDGSFFVSDGYGNNRVMKFSSTGKYLFEWGEKGNDEGRFNLPHGITLDEKGNVYVADRENNRVQVFDSTGRFLRKLTDKRFGSICSVTFDKIRKRIIAVDDATSLFKLKHNGSDIIIFDTADTLVEQFGRTGSYMGPKCWYHDVAVDGDENIYVVDILENNIQKFRINPRLQSKL